MAIRRSLKSLDNRLKSKLNEIIQTHAKELTEPLIVQRDSKYCLPVKIEYKNPRLRLSTEGWRHNTHRTVDARERILAKSLHDGTSR